MTIEEDIEVWRPVVELWKSQGKDLRHLEVPPELASQLGVPLELTRRREIVEDDDIEDEDTMAKKTAKQTKKKADTRTAKKRTRPAIVTETASEPTPVATAPVVGTEVPLASTVAAPPQLVQAQAAAGGEYQGSAAGEKKWKKRSQFDGDSCGYAGCTKKSAGYIVGVRSTKEGERDRRTIWFGPACVSCVREWHPTLLPMTLAELAFQRNGASDLAAVLDIEVGEVHKRLAAAGVDEKGRPLGGQGDNTMNGAPQPMQPQQQMQQPQQQQPGTGIVAREEHHTVVVNVPYDVLAATRQEMATTAAALVPFVIRTQDAMDYASGYLQRVKGLYNHIDELRKALARPFKQVVEQIQEHCKPVLADLQAVELTIKGKIDEAYQWSQQQAAQSFQAAQTAVAAGNPQGVAIATQQAMEADLSLSKGVSMRPTVKFEIIDATQLHASFWSPDMAKIKAAIDSIPLDQLQATLNAGYTPFAGVRVWVENTVAARAA